MQNDPDAFDGPVTLIFSRKVRRGREAEYKAWVAGVQRASRQVAGFLGASTMGPGAAGNDYVSIVRFDTLDHLRLWEESELRREWLAKLPPDTVDGEAVTRRLDGLEFWFTAPGVATPVAPSPHKMALVLLVIVFALVALLTPLVRAALGDVPQLVRSAVMVTLQVGLMTYVIMPRVTRLLAGWLFRR
jgi:antibiotic biosynthesis monooxygenase (ABM) superfamily enzyme